MTATDLARSQFALTVMFHYLFPPLSIGLGALMVVMEGMYLRTGDRAYESMTRFFSRIFAANFAVGVASGIVMEFEFGTNWATYARFVGDVFGSALAAEGIFAFFLESGFLALLIFGWDRISPRMHFVSTVMVFIGSVFSAMWIVIANSWQQTPRGFRIEGTGESARAVITDFWAMVWNPSSAHRIGHVLLGSFTVGAFFVMSVCAFYILKRRHLLGAKKAFSTALSVGLMASLVMLISGHGQAVMVANEQPAKLAAFEGHFHTGNDGAPLWLFGVPDSNEKKVHYGIGAPRMLSVLVYGDAHHPVKGLEEFAIADRPPVAIPFVAYHVMIVCGMYFVGLLLIAAFFRWRGTLFNRRWLMRLFVVSVAGPYIANEAGWVAAEVGRQPWVVYGLLRTKDAVSRTVPGEHIVASIILFSVLYIALFFVWLFVMHTKIAHGPDDDPPPSLRGPESVVDVAASIADRSSGYSLTAAKPNDGLP